MDGGPTVEGSLDALVSGKRSSPRHAVEFQAVVKAVRGSFHARVLDLSLDGARLSIALDELGGEPGKPLGPAEQFGLLEGHFRDSFDVHVPSAGVVMEAQVVRLVVTAEDEDEVELGCRFVQSLTEKQQRELGLHAESDELLGWNEATQLHDIAWIADTTRPVTSLLVDDGEGTCGPLFVGPVTALGKRAILVRLWGLEPDAAVAALSGPGVRARLLRGTKKLYESPCEPVSARYIDTPRPGVELLLALGDALPRSVRKRFTRA